MSERPTPETNTKRKWASEFSKFTLVVPCDLAERLERERDEAREAFAIVTDQLVQVQMENRKLRETMNTDIPDLVTHLDPRSCGMTIQLGEQAAREINDLHRRRVAEMLKRERIAELEQELEDWRNAAKGAENPHPDEVHCTCVPLLRKLLQDAQAEISRLINIEP
jgi:hypothetical protein